MNLREAATLALEALENHTAIKHPQQIHYRDSAIDALRAALAMEERQEMSTPFNPEWLKPGAAVEVSMDNLAAYHAEVQRLMEENAALRAALAEPEQEPVFDCPRCGHCCPQTEQEPVAWMNGWGDLFKNPDEAERGQTMRPLYTAPPQRKPLTDEEIEKAYRHIYHNVPDGSYRTTYYWIEQGIRYAEQAHGIGEKK